MKAKIIIGGALVLAGMAAGIPYLLPDTFQVEKHTVLPAPPAVVYKQLNNLSAWESWSVWNQHADPTLTTFYQGPVAGIGSQCSWKSESSGDGKLIITGNEPDKTIDLLFYPEGEAFAAQTQLKLESVENGTRLTWVSKGSLPGYIDRIKGYRLKTKIEQDLEKGLSDLKKMFESDMKKISLRR